MIWISLISVVQYKKENGEQNDHPEQNLKKESDYANTRAIGSVANHRATQPCQKGSSIQADKTNGNRR